MRKTECWERLRDDNYYVSGTGLSKFWARMWGSPESTSGNSLGGDSRLIISQGKMRGTLRVSGWKLGYWSLRRGQDGGCERAMGRSRIELARSEVPVSRDAVSHRISRRGDVAASQVGVWGQKRVH